MDDSTSSEPRAKRQKKDKFGRTAAFEKLKKLKGSKHKYEDSGLDNIYETVDEKEYTKRVLSRQDDDWIVDDDGTSGYVEDGRDIFDDDLDSESIAAATASKDKGKKKKRAISDQAGKGNLQFMLSNMPTKKKEEVKLDDDDLLSELISEIDDSSVQPKSSSIPKTKPIKPKPMAAFSFASEKQAAKDYMKSFAFPKSKATPTKPIVENKPAEKPIVVHQKFLGEKPSEKILNEIQQNLAEKEDVIKCDEKNSVKNGDVTETQIIEQFDTQEDMFDDDFDMTQIEEFSSQIASEVPDSKPAITEEQLLSGWETMQDETINISPPDVLVDTSQLPMVTNDEGKKVFRFFWWDAFEDKYRQPGVVFLFGKTYCESAKAFVSCCVTVRDIERKVYLLPRSYHLDKNWKETDKPVALIDVYHEFNNECSVQLQLKVFKSKKVTKNYCFNPEIPTQSEYLEIRYSAKNKAMDEISEGKTFSKVFGRNSSFLEIFLLERKIKGACWLDIVSAEPVQNPISWCKFEINCSKPSDVCVTQSNKLIPPPPLVVTAINIRTVTNPKKLTNEIVMISCLVQTKYAVDKQQPTPPFQQHFCVFTKPEDVILPFDIHESLRKFKATKVQKMDSERALLNYFINQFAKIDPDLVVGHDMLGYQISLLSERLISCKATNFSKLGRIRRNVLPKKHQLEKQLFVGCLVCDLKISAKELIKSRSFDLEALCQTVLKLPEEARVEIEGEDVPKMYQTSSDLLKLVSFTMQDTAYILKMMYELNVIPLALQITNIAGNVMSRTLMGGRSERNEFLLLHAFSEKDYIVPEKAMKRNAEGEEVNRWTASKKKPTYAGGLVLDPKVGFYDKFILLMDFNSLYPSIIQEYNICFTTISTTKEDDLSLPDPNLPLGILPTEIRKLVESRREVKKLMNNPDISKDLRMQYNIRQMALKLTANSMYGCLGFSNSRFYAKSLAALVTHKGREILTNTKDLVEKLNHEVIYGDTDSIMINTNCVDYSQVMQIGVKIKQEVNKLYKQVELEIDGLFKYLLLLKKKKYAAVTLSKDKNGELKTAQEHKGIDIVRRDWSQLAAEAGKCILNYILCDQSTEERIENIISHLAQIKTDLEDNKVPLGLLVITKQLTKEPKLYADKNHQLAHVQVALRYNRKGGKPLRAGDTVPYVICEDGSTLQYTQRAYHIDELKTSETLKIDVKYYLSQQIHPVVSRICEPIEGIDSYQIAECLGIDNASFKKPREKQPDMVGSYVKKQNQFRNAKPLVFKCIGCQNENKITEVFVGKVSFLEKCTNLECSTRPIEYLPAIQNQLLLSTREFVKKYYRNELTCEDPACTNDTVRLPQRFAGKYPVCTLCKKGVMYKKYTEGDLYEQLSYFQHIFDLSKLGTKITLDSNIEDGFHVLRETAERALRHSGYSVINLTELFSKCLVRNKTMVSLEVAISDPYFDSDDDI